MTSFIKKHIPSIKHAKVMQLKEFKNGTIETSCHLTTIGTEMWPAQDDAAFVSSHYFSDPNNELNCGLV